MIKDGAPKLIEYNVRLGDPEAQVLMMRLKSDLLPALLAVAEGELGDLELDWHDDAALCVVMAARGYPGPPLKSTEIKRLDEAGADRDVQIFHAGTKRDGTRILADGGRVLGVTARGEDIGEAQRRAYAAVDRIHWPEGFCRRDIGWRAIAREADEIERSSLRLSLDSTGPCPRLPKLRYPAPTSFTEGRFHEASWSGNRGARCLASRHSGGIGAPPGSTTRPCQKLAFRQLACPKKRGPSPLDTASAHA